MDNRKRIVWVEGGFRDDPDSSWVTKFLIDDSGDGPDVVLELRGQNNDRVDLPTAQINRMILEHRKDGRAIIPTSEGDFVVTEHYVTWNPDE